MNKNKTISKEIMFAGKKLVLETGTLALQANLAVKVSYGDTVVLATVVSGGLNPDLDFFPLKVEYEEKMYASGSIKNSRFIKRDGMPTDSAIVTRRLIDHAIRPLFPHDFMDEVRVVITVLSLEPDADPEFVAMIAASVVLHASNIPWQGPMVTTKVGYSENNYVLNPSKNFTHTHTDLEMVVSFVGEDKKFLAIESQSNNLPESKILGAIEFARNNVDPLFDLLNDFAEAINPGGEKMAYEPQKIDDGLQNKANEVALESFKEVFSKGSDKKTVETLFAEMSEKLAVELGEEHEKAQIDKALFNTQKKALRKLIIDENKRPDGRALTEVRPISAEVGVLPRTHGSGLFNRGETQALTVLTLGNPTEELLIQDMYGERAKRYLHYYNFPPFSTGEVGRMGRPGGREIGHGMLAEKALVPVLPSQEEFPYTILLMTEILSSNGSTSMAATCGSTLALMDAGVPIKDIVAGISVGLVSDAEKDVNILLTDIIGLEDFCGNMDFKITGTATGVTAIQLDMKVRGIPMELVPQIFERSKEARLLILEEMKKAISVPRTELSKFAPCMLTVQVKPDQVGMIIGSGGKTIKSIQDQTGAEIGIEDDGRVYITAVDKESAQKAYDLVEGIVKEVEPGEIYDGVVEELADFGAFVEILPGKTGLLHVSEISNEFVEDVSKHLKVGDKVRVKVLEARNGKMSLSIKALSETEPRENGGRNNSGRERFRGNGGRRDDRGSRGRNGGSERNRSPRDRERRY